MAKAKLLPHKDRNGYWRIEIPKSLSSDHPKRRRRHYFNTQAEAENFLKGFKRQQRVLGTSIRILRPAETIDANTALSLLKTHCEEHEIRCPTLRDVAHDWIDHWKEAHRSVSLGKLFDQFLQTKSADSQKHRQSLGYTRQKFDSLLDEKVSSLTRQDIEISLSRLPPASFNAHLRRIKSVLNFGLKHSYLAKNPALLVEPIKRPRQSIKILPVETVELMLRTAKEHTPNLLPFLTISLFAGARPEEINRLEWRDFNLPDKKLIIRPEISKTNQHRTVDLSDNFIEWLNTFDRKESSSRVMEGWTRGTLTPTRNRLWNLMRQQQPTLPKHAPHDVLRHLWVSMFLANQGTIDSLLMQSGHSNAVMFRHYLSICSKADAARYWSLCP